MTGEFRRKMRTSHKLLLVYISLVLIVVAGFWRLEGLANEICENQNEVGMVIREIVGGALVNQSDLNEIEDESVRQYIQGSREQREQFGEVVNASLDRLSCP